VDELVRVGDALAVGEGVDVRVRVAV